MPKVSVIVPVYKIKEDYLNACVKSVLEQTLDDFVADKDFPESVRKYVILDYLNKRANSDVVAVFEDYYEDYINDITQDFEA